MSPTPSRPSFDRCLRSVAASTAPGVWQMPYSAMQPPPIVRVVQLQAAPIVGRAAEVELLAASLEATTEGKPRFLLVTGEAGIGKTRLLGEAANVGRDLGLRVVRGAAIEGGMAMPYLPLLPALAECVQSAADAASAVVRRLVTGEPPSERSDAAAAARLLESIFTVLVREPTLVLVDDVHWADASTVAVLDYLSHRAGSESLSVVAAARDDEPGGLARMAIAAGRRFLRVTPRRLTRPEVAEQVAALLARTPEPDLVSTVFDRSAGNPFFVEQLVAAGTTDAPASLRALAARRLSELSAHARRTVEALAVIGRPADESLVAAVAAVVETAAEGALRHAVDLGVAVAADEGFAFRHPLFAEVIAGELAGSTRRRLHRRAAEALSSRGSEPAETAAHWWHAGDRERAWAASLEAAERAEGAFGFAETRLLLERALSVWPEHIGGRFACALRAANAAWLAGDPAGALGIAKESLAGEKSDSAAVQLALAAYAWDAGEHAEAAAAFERAAELVRGDTPPRVRAEALWALARARIGQDRHEEAREAARQAVELAREACDTVVEARALFTVGLAHAYEGELVGIADVERGVSLAVEAGSPVAIGHGYQFMTNLLHLEGALERALDLSLVGIHACERVGLARSHASDLRGRAALVLIELGRWDDADAVLEPAELRALPCVAWALLAMRRGHYRKAEHDLERTAVGSAIGGSGSEALLGELELAQAELAWLRGDLAASRAALEPPEENRGVWGAAARARRARLAARLNADDPRRPAPETPAADHPDATLDSALRAEIAAERGRAAGASDPRLWGACRRAWHEAGRVYDETYARLREAEALFAADERDRAKEGLREAAASAASLGARPMLALAGELARRARVAADVPRRRDPDRDEPTARELEVLSLLADGLTNREIAARLFVSPKTVGIHVSRLLRKLDAHTRGEAVAVARRRDLLA